MCFYQIPGIKNFVFYVQCHDFKLYYCRAITASSLRKTSSTAEKKDHDRENQGLKASETELNEQIGILNEEIKELKEKNEELTVK